MVLRLSVKFYDEFHLFMIISQIPIVFQVLYSPINRYGIQKFKNCQKI